MLQAGDCCWQEIGREHLVNGDGVDEVRAMVAIALKTDHVSTNILNHVMDLDKSFSLDSCFM